MASDQIHRLQLNPVFLIIQSKIESNVCSYYSLNVSGVVLPVWNPQNPSVGDKVARAIVYFVALIYMFLGMSIIADRFMSSIEVRPGYLYSNRFVLISCPPPLQTFPPLLFAGHNIPREGDHHKKAKRRDHNSDGPNLE